MRDYDDDMAQRERVDLDDYMAHRVVSSWPDEASAARGLCELVENHRFG